ncbi:phospholipase B-like 1 [Dysidea avara]|uniref:phospholipase B-like 1 n=1 Tax=Dysidea avara TaxID=196820 RepID=UPI00332D94A2
MKFIVFTCALVLTVTEGTYTEFGTVYGEKNGMLRFVSGKADKNGIAYGSLEYSVEENGWAVLNIAAGYQKPVISTHTDKTIMMAAGYLEGALTNKMIYDHYVNMYNWTFTGRPKEFYDKAKEWFTNQRSWVASQLNSTDSSNDVIWKYMGLINAQYQGLYDGYNSQADDDKKLDWFAFDILSGNGDMLDLLSVLNPDKPDFDTMSKEELVSWVTAHSHCSVLIKMLPGYENLFGGHSSWFTYASMLRIFKHYAFNLHDQNAATKVMSFSSYPAYLSSLDDFYLMDSGLMMLQTTNGVFNHSIYSLVTYNSLLAWQRVRLANWLATSGKEWAYYVSQYNSGTYNNQYMVVDLKLIQLNQSLPDNSLWVVEQLPGLMVSADQTQVLREGYWASYNVPFYEQVFELSGYADMVKKHGPDFSHDLAVRAKIFRRDQGKVTDMESYQMVMQSNEYKTDIYSEGSPAGAICSRMDLISGDPQSGGCTDTKVTDYNMAKSMTAFIRNGPTHQDIEPFQWSKSPFTIPHQGQPDLFNFGFVTTQPNVP